MVVGEPAEHSRPRSPCRLAPNPGTPPGRCRRAPARRASAAGCPGRSGRCAAGALGSGRSARGVASPWLLELAGSLRLLELATASTCLPPVPPGPCGPSRSLRPIPVPAVPSFFLPLSVLVGCLLRARRWRDALRTQRRRGRSRAARHAARRRRAGPGSLRGGLLDFEFSGSLRHDLRSQRLRAHTSSRTPTIPFRLFRSPVCGLPVSLPASLSHVHHLVAHELPGVRGHRLGDGVPKPVQKIKLRGW